MKKQTIKLVLMLALFLPRISSAQVQGGSGGASFSVPNPLACDTVLCIWDRLYNFIWALAIPVTTVMILYGAYQILTSGGNEQKFSSGRKTILYAVIGLAVVIISGSVPLLIQDILGAE